MHSQQLVQSTNVLDEKSHELHASKPDICDSKMSRQLSRAATGFEFPAPLCLYHPNNAQTRSSSFRQGTRDATQKMPFAPARPLLDHEHAKIQLVYSFDRLLNKIRKP